jgi:hypothetical protein
MEDDAIGAVRLMAEQHLPGLVVCTADGRGTSSPAPSCSGSSSRR